MAKPRKAAECAVDLHGIEKELNKVLRKLGGVQTFTVDEAKLLRRKILQLTALREVMRHGFCPETWCIWEKPKARPRGRRKRHVAASRPSSRR